MKLQPAKNQELELGYQFKVYDDQTGSGSWDDYTAHGVFLTYAFRF